MGPGEMAHRHAGRIVTATFAGVKLLVLAGHPFSEGGPMFGYNLGTLTAACFIFMTFFGIVVPQLPRHSGVSSAICIGGHHPL